MIFNQGNGSGFMTPFTRVVRGVWTPDENEIIKPTNYSGGNVTKTDQYTITIKLSICKLPRVKEKKLRF